MRKHFSIACVIFIIQLLIPISLFILHRVHIHQGQILFIPIQPIDPIDRFMGRYITFNAPSLTCTSDIAYKYNAPLFLSFTIDEKGIATFQTEPLSHKATDNTVKFICKTCTRINESECYTLNISLPAFSRLYIPNSFDTLDRAIALYQQRQQKDATLPPLTIKASLYRHTLYPLALCINGEDAIDYLQTVD